MQPLSATLNPLEMKNVFSGLLLVAFKLATAMIGYSIHKSVFWSIIDFIFSPIAWIKWLVCHEVNWTIIRHTFEFLTK